MSALRAKGLTENQGRFYLTKVKSIFAELKSGAYRGGFGNRHGSNPCNGFGSNYQVE